MDVLDAALDIELGPYADWAERERVVVNVAALYHNAGADVPTDAATLLTLMVQFRRRSG